MTPTVESRQHERHADLDRLFAFIREIDRDVKVLLIGQDAQKNALVDHMVNEESAMKTLNDRLKSGDTLMKEMTDKLDALTHIQIAFPQDLHGKPDLIGHRMGHERDKVEDTETRAIMLEGKKKVAGIVVEWFFRLLSLGMVAYIAQHIGSHTL